ncbi:GNAT family N-acetyltransferase [Pedobacter sp. ASV28]|uniref:GNAT family N-acetyltransferase n=1 Tax=Pedobacter sp. ASV28 TaxID=2795123 RepID=UPI0018EE3589|nr:GNAT family N-acetyltransferase [Pedobacter sp. ASV28]
MISKLDQLKGDDLNQILNLSGQLGYENNVDTLSSRLSEIIKQDDHAIFVARVDQKIVGWLHCLVGLRVESPLFVEVAGLVVDEQARGLHIGRNLIETSKQWSANLNISKMLIRCNVLRTETHKFYHHLGFQCNKEQKIFELDL